MTLALIILGGISLLELLLWFGPIWNIRKFVAYPLVLALAAFTGAILAIHISTWVVLISIITLYRITNLLRIIQGRVQANYLYHGTRQTALLLISAQIFIVACLGLGELAQLNILGWWYLLASWQVLVAGVLLVSTIRHLRTTYPPALQDAIAERDLPSLTVAIPARNETDELRQCLESLIASSYPKLEILVLDDCSQDRHTPEIIRGFAHDGVRFIAGVAPPDQWLAKNYAYAQLAEAANGELLLFCGVDVSFEPQSLTILVKTMLQKQKSMISIMPRNMLPKHGGPLSLFIQPNRYAWEIALPRRLLHRPPVLSTCWLITRKALRAAGGFQAVSRKGVPESYLARTTANDRDGYSFMQANTSMGISCQKSLEQQRATAIRTRYLQLHRRPELVALVAAGEFSVLVWPLILLVVAIVSQTWLLAAMSGAATSMTVVTHSKIINLTYRRFVFAGLWIVPLAAIYDIGLLNYSMWQYEFDEVLWKGRNVCIPMMRVIPPENFIKDLG